MTNTDETLREMVKTIKEYAQGRSVKTAFWKNGIDWHSYTFELDNKKLREKDKQFLESIKKDDPKTVVIDSADYKKISYRGLPIDCSVDCMVADTIYYYNTGQANISNFLEEYADKEAQQDVMTIKEVVKIMEKRLKQLADWEMPETVNGNSISAEMLEIAKFLIEVKKQRLDWE